MKKVFVFLMMVVMVIIVANATAENYDHFLDTVGIQSLRAEYSEAIANGRFLEDNVVLYNDTIYIVSDSLELNTEIVGLEGTGCFTLGELQTAMETMYGEHGYPGVKVSAEFTGTFNYGWALIAMTISADGNMNDMEGGYLMDGLFYNRIVCVTKVK